MTGEVDKIVETTYAAATLQHIDRDDGDLIAAIVPNGYRLDIHDLERYGEAPARKQGVFEMYTTESVATYVNAHQEAGTALFADVQQTSIVAIINGHIPQREDADQPGWMDHRVSWQARLTPEWDAWIGIDGTYLSQTAFAEFLEDHVGDIVNPPAADLLELAKTFEVTANNDFKSAIRLDSGQRQLTYVETIEGRAGQQGQIVIPETIDLALRPFEGADPYKISARFRYRLDGAHLKLGIVLHRPDLVLADAFNTALGAVELATELHAYQGRMPR